MAQQGPPSDPFGELIAHNAAVRARPTRRRRTVAFVAFSALLLVGLALIGYGISTRIGSGSHLAETTAAENSSVPGVGTPTTAGTFPTSSTPVPATTIPHVRSAHLVIRAARGDSWVEIRAGTAAGRVLYSGILRQGETTRADGKVLWLRFGSVGNLDLELNGKLVHTAHSGTVDATVTPGGIE